MFHNLSKVIQCDRRDTLARFSEDDLHFSWQAQHFGHVQVHFARFFFLRIALSGLRQVVATCKLRGARGARGVECGVWSVECEIPVQNVESECSVWCVECRFSSVDCGE